MKFLNEYNSSDRIPYFLDADIKRFKKLFKKIIKGIHIGDFMIKNEKGISIVWQKHFDLGSIEKDYDTKNVIYFLKYFNVLDKSLALFIL